LLFLETTRVFPRWHPVGSWHPSITLLKNLMGVNIGVAGSGRPVNGTRGHYSGFALPILLSSMVPAFVARQISSQWSVLIYAAVLFVFRGLEMDGWYDG
jgi:hypothetical protein